MKIRTIIFITSLILIFNLNAQTKKVLFIGNSYTEANNLPLMISNLSSSMGKTLEYETHTMGGARFMGHWNGLTNSGLFEKIKGGGFDFIVLQGQSQEVAFPDVQFYSDVYPYAEKLDSIIKLYSPQSKVVFYMTWGYRYGDSVNCQFFSPFCNFWSMTERLYHNYSLMASDFNSWIAPVGAAWRESISRDSTIVLHSSDNSHPSLNGTYLSSCVFYSTFFHDSIFSQDIPSGMNSNSCQYLQNISNTIVFDSLAYWLQNQSPCGNPANLSHELNFIESDSSFVIYDLSWTGTGLYYDLRYKKTDQEDWQRVLVDQNTYQLSLSSGDWQWRVKSLCDNFSQSYWIDTSLSFTTSLYEIPKNISTFNIYYSQEYSKLIINIENINEDADIEVINLNGQVLINDSAKPIDSMIQRKLDLNNFNDGLYIIRIKTKLREYSYKIIKS